MLLSKELEADLTVGMLLQHGASSSGDLEEEDMIYQIPVIPNLNPLRSILLVRSAVQLVLRYLRIRALWIELEVGVLATKRFCAAQVN